MNMFRAFMELDMLNEAAMTRHACIDKLKAFGKHYNFDKYSDAQIYRMWEKAEKENTDNAAMTIAERPACDVCGCLLTDSGHCPACDDGEEDY